MADPEFKQVFVRLRSRKDGELIAPLELRERLVAEATEAGTNLTDVASKILAEKYGVEWEPSGRKSTPHSAGEELNLRLPLPLYRAVAIAAAGQTRTPQREILATLCGHYNLAMPSAIRRTRQRAA